MNDIKVLNVLNNEALLFAHKIFNVTAGCDWTLKQFKQSLKNQEYLKFLVFYQNSEIIGIANYSTDNPWNKTIIDVMYSKDNLIYNHIIEYINNLK